MNKKHMLKMIEALKKPQPKSFDFNQHFWFREEKGNKKKKNCGCVAAILVNTPYFKKLGLKKDEGYSGWITNVPVGMGQGEHRELGLIYKKQHGIGALEKLFELSSEEAIYIFGGVIGKTKKDAQKRIQEIFDHKLEFQKPADVSNLLAS